MSMHATRIAVSRGMQDVARMVSHAMHVNCGREFPFLLVAIHHENQGHHISTMKTPECIAAIEGLLGRWKNPPKLLAEAPPEVISLQLALPGLGQYVREAWKVIADEPVFFMLLITTVGGPLYISTVHDRDIAAKLLQEHADAWRADEPSIPAHAH